jgi:hypothetical protein
MGKRERVTQRRTKETHTWVSEENILKHAQNVILITQVKRLLQMGPTDGTGE